MTNIKKKESNRQALLRPWYWMPTAVFILGVLSAVILIWVYWIAERQRVNFEHINAVMDIQNKTATFHLWFEEALTKGNRKEMQRIFIDLDAAMKLSDALVFGGKSEHGIAMPPLDDPIFLGYAKSIRALLIRFREIALQRYRNPETAGIGSSLDEQINAVFGEFQERARALELAVDKNKIRDDAETRRLLLVTILLWTFIVVLSAIGFCRLELRRRQAVDALEGSYEEAEQMVKLRTAELTAVNKNLLTEIAERKQTEETLKESERQIRHLSFQLLRAQEIERRRISMELHDELGQALNVMKLRIGALERDSRKDPRALREDYEQLLAYLDDIIDEVRRLSLALSPRVLEDLGLTSAIRWLIGNFERIPGLNVNAAIEEIDHLFHQNDRMTIYRVIQEALTNISRYAEARNVSVSIRRCDGKAVFSIEDDGNGFEPERVVKQDASDKGFGLATMNERVRMMGGSFDLTSRAGEGTKISFYIPVEAGGN